VSRNLPRRPPEPPEPLLTAEERERADRIQEDVQRQAARAEEPDVYVGRTPEQIAEQEEAARPGIERAGNERSSAEAERRIQTLEDQLAETMQLVKKLARDRGGYDAVAAEAELLANEHARRRVYERIAKNGGWCTIVVHTHEDPSQNFPVYLRSNDIVQSVKRGVPTVIPVQLLEVLDHALVDHWVKEVDQNENPILRRELRLSYPYALLDYTGQQLPAV